MVLNKYNLPGLLCGLLCSSSLLAQSEFWLHDLTGDSAGHRLSFRTEVMAAANPVDNAFIWSLFTTSETTNADKQRVSDRLQASNRAGADVNADLAYSLDLKPRTDSSGLRGFVRFAQRQHASLGFPPGAFDLTFFGNKRFAGESVPLDDLHFQTYRYQQLQVGVAASKSNYQWGAGLSVLNGNHFLYFDAPEATLFTSQIGDSLHVTADAVYQRSDTSQKAFFAPNGIGASVDLFGALELPILESFGPARISLEVQDLGLIAWSDQSLEVPVDTSIGFTGIILDDLFDINDSTTSNNSPDTIVDDLRAKQRLSSHQSVLPARIHLRIEQPHHERYRLTIGVDHRIAASYQPLVYVAEEMTVSKLLGLRAQAGYGGYGQLQVGLQVALRGKSWGLRTGSQSVLAMALPESQSGTSFYLMLHKQF